MKLNSTEKSFAYRVRNHNMVWMSYVKAAIDMGYEYLNEGAYKAL